jgi:hypothetical protein
MPRKAIEYLSGACPGYLHLPIKPRTKPNRAHRADEYLARPEPLQKPGMTVKR